MIGLILLAVIGLWAVIAVMLALKMPTWLNVKRYRLGLSFALAPIFFLMPVADEVIAWPQMRTLCKNAERYRYDETKAAGRKVSKYVSVISKETRILFPNIRISITEYGHLSIEGEEPILSWYEIESDGGMLKFPAGSSGTHMSLILPSRCTTIPAGSAGHQAIIRKLNLQLFDTQPAK